ncbi:MAG: alpha/beta hydrolase [Clostridiales bacterium]|nr:alpha/beta hydrolase [Clostridiales bacterium]
MEITLDGIKINYQEAGSGHPVLLLHGWGANLASLGPVQQALAQGFQLFCLDLPGFGASAPPPAPWGSDDYADLLEKFLAAKAIEKPIILGHSFGGKLAAILGIRGLAQKLILVGSAGIPPKRGPDYYARVYSYKLAKRVLGLPGLSRFKTKALARWEKANASSDYQQASGVMRTTFVKVVNEDLRRHLPRITVPTLLVWGELDTATPPPDGQLMEKLIPDSGLVILEGAGHYAYLDKLPEFLLICESFLAPEKQVISNR